MSHESIVVYEQRMKRSRKERIIMLRNLPVTAYGKRPKPFSGNDGAGSAAYHNNQVIEATIDDLYNNSRSGLRGLFIFLCASAIALFFIEHSLAGSVPADIMDLLGSTPSVILVNCVFGASTISSLISITGRIYHGLEPGKTSTHLWFRMFFFLLYFTSGALSDYFNVVFISGLVVLGLQHYNVWNYYMRAIELKTDKCKSMNRYGSRL
ncbi:MAG TPA: hypothetical protein VN642_04410 [Dongiaceae bacterium]|nr:hypothetical protein [Dongiaceae bacterium]